MSHQDAQEFLAELSEVKNDLPYSPTLLHDLFLQTEEGSQASLEDVAETISADQGLTARIMRLANSAFYGLQSEVATVRRAATVLGLKEIRNMIVALGVRGLTRTRELPGEFDLASYWKHQLQVGLAARRLGQMAGCEMCEGLFTAGLLHDLGKLVCALYRPGPWREMVRLAREEGLEDCDAEDRYWGLDHAVVGGLVLKSWSLPVALVEPVNWHHAPELANESAEETAVLALADAYAHAWDGEEDEDTVWTGRVEAMLEELELDAEAVEDEVGDVFEDETVDHFISMLV